MTRKSFNAKERFRLFNLYGGVCYLCDGGIHQGEAWEIEHVVAWELSRDDSDDNLRLAHFKCHKVKTASDIRNIRKADRIFQKHNGLRPPSDHAFPYNRKSPLKMKFGGKVVPR